MQKHRTVLASFTTATAVLCLSALAACGSSTAPSAPSFSEARHLDTLALQAASESAFDRFRLLQYPVALLARGVSPESVTVSVNGTGQVFEVGALELVGTTAGKTPTPNDSTFVLVAWQGADVSQLVYLLVDPQSNIIDEAELNDTTANFNLTLEAVSASLTKSAGACPTLKLDTPSNLINAKCTKATITGAFDVTFVDPKTDASTRFVLTSQSIPGVRLLLTGSNGGQDIITDLKRPHVRQH
ncbi:MAG TPA: hypothetical protein VJO52_15965 [Gemmatimonadaceae bacterium]|nr:hypothetical protein [Gemmatimonadaceae bacterium]